MVLGGGGGGALEVEKGHIWGSRELGSAAPTPAAILRKLRHRRHMVAEEDPSPGGEEPTADVRNQTTQNPF